MLQFLFDKTPLYFFVQSIWRDEAFSYLMAKRNIFQILIFSARDFSPPFYPLLLKLWGVFFGFSEIAMRSISLLAFILSFIFFFLFLEKILKIKGHLLWISSLLFLANPFLNYYAFEARVYSLFTLFTIMSYYFFLRKKEKAYILSSALGLYSHYFMVLVLISQAFVIALDKGWKNLKIKDFKLVLTPFYFFIPWILFFLFQNPFLGTQFWIEKPNFGTLINLPATLYLGYENDFDFFKKYAVFFSLFLFLILIWGIKNYLKKSRDNRILYVFLSWSFLPSIIAILISLFKPVFFPRYLIFSTPGLLLLLTLIFSKKQRFWRFLFLAVLIIFTLSYNRFQIKERRKDPIREVSQVIKTQMKKGDLVYVVDVLDYHPAQYYLGEDKIYIYNKSYDEIPPFVGKVLIFKDKLTNTLPIYPRKAFIIKEGLSYDIQSMF